MCRAKRFGLAFVIGFVVAAGCAGGDAAPPVPAPPSPAGSGADRAPAPPAAVAGARAGGGAETDRPQDVADDVPAPPGAQPVPVSDGGGAGAGASGDVGAQPSAADAGDTGAPGGSPADLGDAIIRGSEPTRESASRMGPYEVARYSEGFQRGSEFAGATISYPRDAEPPFSMIVFCPGWLGTQASNAAWAPFMASHGIVFMYIDTNTISDGVLQRRDAEWEAVASLRAEHTRPGSPLEGKLALDRVGLMGWSMGGGGAWLNGKDHPEVRSLITLAGHNATAGGAGPARGLTVPTLMFAGTADTAILGLGMSQPVYEVIPESTPKMLYEVAGASHFAFNDPAFNDGVTGLYALSWQKVYLEGDMRYYPFLLEEGPKASDFRSNLE